jgi:hypothetical protein
MLAFDMNEKQARRFHDRLKYEEKPQSTVVETAPKGKIFDLQSIDLDKN